MAWEESTGLVYSKHMGIWKNNLHALFYYWVIEFR